jgi:hypothetical protein
MAAAIMGDDAVAMRCQKEHLIFECICRERPAVTEDDRLTLTPILVVDFSPVFGGDGAHGAGSLASDARWGFGAAWYGDGVDRAAVAAVPASLVVSCSQADRQVNADAPFANQTVVDRQPAKRPQVARPNPQITALDATNPVVSPLPLRVDRAATAAMCP